MTKLENRARFLWLAVWVFFCCGPPARSVSAMVVDLGETSPLIKVTPEYSEAALTAALPYFSEAARKLGLPVPQPITRADIASSHALPFRDLAVSIRLNNGWAFTYSMGHVSQISDTHGYASLQDPAKIPLYYGAVRLTTNEAVKLARDAIEQLGVTNGELWTDQEPKATGPEPIGTNIVAHYEVAWINPADGHPCIDVHINANTQQLEKIAVISRNLRLYTPKLAVTPVADHNWPSVNPEYAHQLIPLMFAAIDEYAKKLSLPVPSPLRTNNVARVKISDNGGWPVSEVVLTNGWRFVYRHSMVNGYFSPKVLLTNIALRPFRLKEVAGKWNMDTNQAIVLVKKTIARLNYATNHLHLDFAPRVDYFADGLKQKIPDFVIAWDYKNSADNELQSRVEAEVNAHTGTVESLYYDDKAYWSGRPPIQAPISIKK